MTKTNSSTFTCNGQELSPSLLNLYLIAASFVNDPLDQVNVSFVEAGSDHLARKLTGIVEQSSCWLDRTPMKYRKCLLYYSI